MRSYIAILATLTPSLAAHAQAAVVPWTIETCSAPTQASEDIDLDNLVDACEYALASAFEPVLLIYDAPVQRSARAPFWSARLASDGKVHIFYAAAYLHDYGVGPLQTSGHRGDSEFIVAELEYAGGLVWRATSFFLSRHYHAPVTDSSDWFDADDLFAYHELSHPYIHVAKHKHSNYRTQSECNERLDECIGQTGNQWLGVHRNNFVGSMLAPINPNKYYDLDANGISDLENFWTDVRFCGWQNSSNTNRSRWTCANPENTYYNQLGNLEFTGCEGTLSTGSLERSEVTHPPSGTYYAGPGRHVAHLAESRSGNLILSLWRWTGQQWLSVATDNAWGPSKTIDYTGPAGYYVWQVWAALGSGDYTMCSR